jgi:hypothetical protein
MLGVDDSGVVRQWCRKIIKRLSLVFVDTLSCRFTSIDSFVVFSPLDVCRELAS